MTHQILSLSGEPIGQTLEAYPELPPVAQPATHEPRWFRRVREEADARFASLYKQALGDLNAPQTPGTTVNAEHVVRQYQHLWAQYAHHILKSTEPIPVNVNAMKEQLEASINASLKNAKKQQPLRDLESLTEFDMAFVGVRLGATVWACNAGTIMITDEGVVNVWIAEKYTPCGYNPEAPYLRNNNMVLSAPLLTMQQLHNLFAALRVEAVVQPPATQIKAIAADLKLD